MHLYLMILLQQLYTSVKDILKINEKGKNMTLFLLIMFTPIKYLKFSKILAFTFFKILSEMFNFYIDNNTFPNQLEKVDIKPVYKKPESFDKTDYRPISILHVLSKAFERCFWKGFSTQYSLIATIEKWRKKWIKAIMRCATHWSE